ncbi:ribbon-helix-helix DNA binding domain protein [Mycobacterium phage Thonko]|uniref:Ribbon-helix-helix DNA binding domain protein n=1 Tax=Mycobacterium phage Thonko TaxID=2282910 RepID=A0A346FCB4_9CAUD|nr:ribbon-helix-helix DNA binding domain protein [Mycobacterium phage Thonko]AXN53339.1 ribbon-helix-helix DNA binding domain protein [Mycobacterium phage Thonko]
MLTKPEPTPRMRGPVKGLIPVKGTAEQHRRLKVAAAEEGMTYIELIEALLDIREERIERRRRQQPSPLHRPADEAANA